MLALEVKNIRKSFGKTEVLRGIDFQMEKGEVLVIIGSSGSGKTTLLRSLNFLETPDEGEIWVNGSKIFEAVSSRTPEPAEKRSGFRLGRHTDLRAVSRGKQPQESDAELRKKRLHFGMVFQSFNLFPQYTVLSNLTLAAKLLRYETAKLEYKQKIQHASAEYRESKDKAAYAAAKKAAKEEYRAQKAAIPSELEATARDLLRKVGLSDKADSYPWQLSGGQQQRVAIARALALSPDILCFDEPTSALDPELTDEVLGVIRGLKSGDSTMIVVTHEMNFAAHVADKIIFMANGVIEEMGTPEELFNNPKSEALQHFLAKTTFNI